jgi:Skp family chaperone for outer membrane proteins
MVRSRAKAAMLAVAAVAPLALLVVACGSRPPEQQLLTQFFRAAKARDNATLAMMSAVSFNPREQGTVEDFTITSVGAEQRVPVDLKALVEADRRARAAEAEFQKRKKEYSDANLTVINEVLKLERDPKAKMSPAQTAVKGAWDKWREETASFQKQVSAAREALSKGSGVPEASLTQPGQPDFKAEDFAGEIVRKDVQIEADVQSPDGAAAKKPLTVTFERAVGTVAGTAREGRWIITRIAGL